MPTLPPEFNDLDPYIDWALPTEPERYTKRLNSTMPQMQQFYDAAFPRIQDAITHCDKHTWGDLPDDTRTLFHLMQSLINISFPIEVWKQPRVPDSGAAMVQLLREPVV
ncbi:hypothetical protein OHB12_05825 [Nocardia sp. NBC_01730]|uniref:hypothetical protein n=1 Tax=Nocardia sp. NBC_01730 TaxID=2975998 RepID=UPI002E0E9A4C|nr:hypothetical protein OHB12_05525 [Nocardia sp. NBC_01730]WSG60990.1 hypothetical protein OHB12_05825 [Nocardia sp. NBC_01730]